jgi:hypothetical protein
VPTERPVQRGLREPGQYARERGLELAARPVLLGVGILAIAAIAWAVFGLRGLPIVGLELVAICLMVALDRLYSPQADRWLRGAAGEQAVGAICAELEADGWHAIHDVSFGKGNVDHIIVGPGGIFTIETKSRRDRVRVNGLDPRMLKQAYAEKKLIERITGLDVQPLLVFSQAWLVGSVPARRGGVVVLPARMLRHYCSRRRPVLDANAAAKLHGQLVSALFANV